MIKSLLLAMLLACVAPAAWAQQIRFATAADDASLARYATEAGVEGEAVLVDLQEGRYREQIRQSFMGGARSGVNGTPTLFIDGIRSDGPRDEPTLVAALELVAEEAEGGRAPA